jgi:hypothetical protein
LYSPPPGLDIVALTLANDDKSTTVAVSIELVVGSVLGAVVAVPTMALALVVVVVAAALVVVVLAALVVVVLAVVVVLVVASSSVVLVTTR